MDSIFTFDRIDISSVPYPGAGIFSSPSLSVFFRRDSIGAIGLFNGAFETLVPDELGNPLRTGIDDDMIPTPVVLDGVAYVHGGGPRQNGSLAVRTGGDGDVTDTHVVWSGKNVTSPPSPVVVLRNEAVVIRIQRPELLVTAMGIALQEARAGECVKVRNVDSSRVVLCRVNTDGTVEPML